MTATHVALLRGINVGRAKRVAMADLRALVTDLGYTGVQTLLNSGNVVFGGGDARAATRIEEGLSDRLGVRARVTVLTTRELATAIEENPLPAGDPSRLLVSVPADPGDLRELEPLLEGDWAPEALALGSRVAYLRCPDGVAKSPLSDAVGKALGDAVTARNWKTMTKLLALAEDAG